jgi:hypothetical protein
MECLAADKMTAFAPATIGVQYAAYGASMKILKHCADVGTLYDHCKSMDAFRKAYDAIWPVENFYRNNAFTREQVQGRSTGSLLLLAKNIVNLD